MRKAKKADFGRIHFRNSSRATRETSCKYARPENRLPGLPDDVLSAQFLAIAEWPRLEALLSDVAAERKESGYSYGSYLTIALQRIHGLSPARVREMQWRLRAL